MCASAISDPTTSSMSLSVVAATIEHLRKPVTFVSWASSQSHESRMRLLSRRRHQGRSHSLRSRLGPLGRLVGEDQHRGQAMSPRGSDPTHRTLANVFLSSILACWPVSQTRQRSRSLSSSPMNARTCSNAILACSNDDATNTVSPRGTANGPFSVAAAIPESNDVFPLPLATDIAAEVVPSRNAPE